MKSRIIILVVILLSSGCQVKTNPFEYDLSLKSVYAEGNNSYYIDQNNALLGWGQEFGDMPNKLMENVFEVKSNFKQYLVLKSDGSLWEWGSNRKFSSSFEQENHIPTKELENVKRIWTNSESLTYVLMNDDSLWYIGGDECRIIDETMINSHISGRVLTKIMDDVVDLAVSWRTPNAIAKKKDGSYWAWGSKVHHNEKEDDILQTLLKDVDENCITTPKEVELPYTIKGMIYTAGTIYFIDEVDTLWGWGNNNNHRINKSSQTYIENPKLIMENVSEVQATEFCTFVLLKDQSLWGWGNRLGCLGLGYDDPVIESTMLLKQVKMFSADIAHTLVILENDTLWGWGTNKYSQLGRPKGREHKVPVMIGKLVNP